MSRKVLITPYWFSQDYYRQKEIEQCLLKNLTSDIVDEIILVCDESIPPSLPIFRISKLRVEALGHRPTYSDMFRIADKYSDEDTISIISNSDIMMTDSISRLDEIKWDEDVALALTRWELLKSGEVKQLVGCDSQDTWVFKGKIKPMFSEFELGAAGCDNRICREIELAGYKVYNPSLEIITIHLHLKGQRTYNPSRPVPPHPKHGYKLIHPHHLDIVPQDKPIKIFHIGMYAYFAEKSISHALNKMGTYNFVDWQNYIDWKSPSSQDPKLLQEFERLCIEGARWCNILFMQLQTPNVITPELMQKMKLANPSMVVFNWTGDVRQELPQDMIDIAPYCISLFTNDDDTKKMRALGFKSEYLQIGFDQNIYNTSGYINPNAPEIVFFGNNYTDKGKWIFPNGEARYNMVIELKKKYGRRFGVYGSGWNDIADGDVNSDAIKEASIYRGAKIAINYSHFNKSRYSSDRIMRIMGSGCFCLSHEFPDINVDYKSGEELNIFTDFNNLCQQIDYYLSRDEKRKEIATAGNKYAHGQCTWDKRFKELRELYNKEINA